MQERLMKFLRFSLLILLIEFISISSYAQFPYTESFRYSTAPGITFGGAPSAFLTAARGTATGGGSIDNEGEGYLRLTRNSTNQKGYIISNAEFPSYNGVKVVFEYYIYGGSGADGISLFLFDASADPFNIGGFGGSLGYAQITTTNPVSPGVSKGYLAIGLDEYGNFSNPTEGRQGGIGLKPGSVTLRGKGNGDALTPDNYRYLTSVQTSEITGDKFDLVGNSSSRQPDSTATGYRRVSMNLEPNPAGGFNITVNITRGGIPTRTSTVIDKYYYPDPAPAFLRYGIASSTGDQTNFHEIRNVYIDVFNETNLVAPQAGADQASLCKDQIAVINVVANDTTLNKDGTINASSIDLDPSTAGIQSTYTVNGQGTFAVNSDGNVQFTPESSFVGTVTGYYTVNDTYGKTSNVATITLTYSDPPSQPDAGKDSVLNITGATGSYILQGTNASPHQGKWTQLSGPNTATIGNDSAPNALLSNLTGGVYVFRWTVTSASGCSLFDDMQLTVNHRPVAVSDTVTTSLNTHIPIAVLANDSDADGDSTIDKASITIKSNPTNGTLITDPVSGVITYRPNTGFSGYDSFVYTVKDNYGVESNTAIVTIAVNIKPEGSNDVATTIANVPVDISVLDNDRGRAGASVIKTSDPKGGTVALNANGSFTYSPSPGFSGVDIFTYQLENKEGLFSDSITVTVNVKPVGTEDAGSTPSDTPVTIAVKDNDDSKTGTSVIPASAPQNGSAVVNADGTLTYTPNEEFTGLDSCTYILRTATGLESEPIKVKITVTALPPGVSPKIGLAKASTSPVKNPDGSFNVGFTFSLVNFSTVKIDRLSLTDDLAGAFPGATIAILSLSATGSLQVDDSFDGSSHKELLKPESFLNAFTEGNDSPKETVSLEVRVVLGDQEGTFYNTAYVEGYGDGSDTKTTDQSTNGYSPDSSTPGDPSPSELTPVKLIKQPIYIPGGFSPNNDGVNDAFIIENAGGKKISLEIYNRWGNRVYRSRDYQNDWRGRCTEGIHVGEDVPVGTYYYIIEIDNKDKQVGYITINR